MEQNIKNPFAEKCVDCTPNIWQKIQYEMNKLNNKCSENTYVWIEKFKDDNY